MKLIGDVEISHLSLCFVLRISESFVDLEDCGGMVGCCASIIYLFSFYLISFHLFSSFYLFFVLGYSNQSCTFDKRKKFGTHVKII